jgi:hypothetical protein
MNTHEQIKELLTDYALRELPEQKSSEVKQHLADCQQCRDELKKLEAVLKCADSMNELSVDEQVCESAKESLLTAVANEEQQEPTSRPTIRLDLIWRTIMKSRIIKLAAAVIIIAVLAGVPFFGDKGSGIALAAVLEKINQTNAYMYTTKMTITGKLILGVKESTILTTVSDDFGLKSYVENTDPNTGKTTTQQHYFLPEKKMSVTIMPETKQYIRMPFSDELLARMKQQNNDPREMIMQIMKCEYTRLDKAVIDGVEVEGFRTTDPAFIEAIGGDTSSIEFTLWVDVENWLPFLSEMDLKSGEQMQVTDTTYNYRWNVPVHASDFDPVIPEDFKPFLTNGMKMPGMSESAAIEGLRLFAEITGQYPQKMNMLELAQEITALKDSQYINDLLEKLKEMKQNTEMSNDELRDAFMKKWMTEIMQPIQSISYFYMTLVTDKKEPVYYGESVGPENADMVLLKWKVSDDHYRVIFGDLTAKDLTADQFNEIEK